MIYFDYISLGNRVVCIPITMNLLFDYQQEFFFIVEKSVIKCIVLLYEFCIYLIRVYICK